MTLCHRTISLQSILCRATVARAVQDFTTMMRTSIRIRLLLAMNLLVVGVGVAVGWTGVAVSGRIIEHRLVDQTAANAAGLFKTMQLPMSDVLMTQLRQILGAEVAAGSLDPREIVATSLPGPEAAELKVLAARAPLPRRLTLAGTPYLAGMAEVPERGPPWPARQPMRLYVLVPESQVAAAKQASEQTLLWVTIAAIAAATLLAFWLSRTILRPIRRLATRMDALAERASEDALPAAPESSAPSGPAEIAGLARSFDQLLGRLEEARRKLARSARLATVGQLSASVAHELRNPLSGIKMNARVLADELARSGLADSSLDRIIREADRMELYLGELLSLASGEGPPPPHDLAALPRVRLDTVGESVLGLLEHRCRHANVSVRRAWDDLASEVQADETQIRQVALNLALNALDAMPAGGVLTLSTRPGRDGTVRFSASDTGPGVQVPEGADLFEPFVTTKSGGVGLGLYVCRRNVERHGGRLGYDSSDSGATFWFELPAAGPPDETSTHAT
jgi:signal transduction histidine kinase